MEILVRNNANVNLQNKDGETPLHAAVEKNHLNVVEILVQNLANVDVKNNADWTPYCRSRNLGNFCQPIKFQRIL